MNDLDEHIRNKAYASPKIVLPTGMVYDVYLKGTGTNGSLFRLSKDEAKANEAIYTNGREIAILTSKVEIHLKFTEEVLKALAPPTNNNHTYYER